MTSGGHPMLGALEAGEEVVVEAHAREAAILVTDRRLAVVPDAGRLAMNIPIEELRRIQFDIERTRPATLVIVPDHPGLEPQVLSIPTDQIDATTTALAFIAKRLPQAPQPRPVTRDRGDAADVWP